MTYEAVLTLVRDQIGDAKEPYYWDDAKLTRYIDGGVEQIALRAPWLRLTTGGSLVTSSVINLAESAKQALVDYTAWKALSEDVADASLDGRADRFKAQWEGAVL